MPVDPVLVTLPAKAGIHEAAVLAATVAEALTRGVAVRIDTGPVTGADLSTVQLLVAAHRQAVRDGVALEITVPEDGAVAAALRDFGALEEIALAGGLWTGVPAASGQVQ